MPHTHTSRLIHARLATSLWFYPKHWAQFNLLPVARYDLSCAVPEKGVERHRPGGCLCRPHLASSLPVTHSPVTSGRQIEAPVQFSAPGGSGPTRTWSTLGNPPPELERSSVNLQTPRWKERGQIFLELKEDSVLTSNNQPRSLLLPKGEVQLMPLMHRAGGEFWALGVMKFQSWLSLICV